MTLAFRPPILIFALTLALAISAVPARAASPCVKPPPAVLSLQLPRYYADRAGIKIDAKRKRAHRKLVKPLTRFLRHVVKQTDKALRRSNPTKAMPYANCALSWLRAWADAGALLGKMDSKQAQYQRKWDMTGLALAYLKLRQLTSPEQRASIEPWLMKLADASTRFFDNRDRRRNNHWYWLGLGLGAVALATESKRHWRQARAIMLDAANDIGPDGALDFEMARGGRALKYHAFAVMPLIVLAELAHAKGENWYRFGNGALHRLVKLTIAGFADPTMFKAKAGAKQKRPIKPGAGWAQLYQRRFPGKLRRPFPSMKPGHRWLGGNALLLKPATRQQEP